MKLPKSVTGLTASTNYFYRVRAYNAGGTSGNSNTISTSTAAQVRTLIVKSINPNSSVSINVSPTDNNGAGNGATEFSRSYNLNANVTLTAPATASGNTFQKWQKDGADYATDLMTNVTLDADHTLTAIYITTSVATPTGQNVSVQLNGVTVTFGNVTSAGNTTILPINPSGAGNLPSGYQLSGSSLAFDISTAAGIQPPIGVCFSVPSVTDPTAFGQLRILHNENGTLYDRTSSQNFASKMICASVNSLSPFVLANAVVPAIQFNGASFNVNEADGFATIDVTRLGDTAAPATVNFTTTDGTASQRIDYTLAAGTLTFAAGQVNSSFNVLVINNVKVDGSRTVNLNLSNPTGAPLGTPASVVLTIADNDSVPPTTNPLDNADARFFVQQHYYDFLSRYPDQGGWDFWVGQITQCGNDPNCIRNKRIDVSNAFYYELEFQQTGSYVYRLYRAAYGNNQPLPNPAPDPLHPGEEKKVPLYLPFITDRAQVRGGSELAQLQLALANSFVQRTQFTTKYPASLATAAQFVDAILATINTDIGVDLGSQRQALIDLYNAAGGGNAGRGNVIYRLADDNVQTNPINNRSFIDAEYNRAFVYTQYAGYLRRDPDMPGFLFWLGQVNHGPLRDGNTQHAMVCSFITSDEYQQRFSPIVTHHNSECPQ